MLFIALALILSISTWGLGSGVVEAATVALLLVMLPAAVIDSRISTLVMLGPLSALYVLFFLGTAWVLTPAPGELRLPLLSDGGAFIGGFTTVNNSDMAYTLVYLVAAGIYAYKQMETHRRRRS
ncbi:MAG: hypothetical protein F4X54_07545 [Chloroflexi bacterium]|nr:hypothetical protein [Chloroflexota bacterium]MYB84571.1 hypothetical protein [Chloroflexota bacterium]